MIISLKFIKYIKLCIISPAYDITINILIIILFFIISFLIQSQGIQLNNYQLTEMVSDIFKESTFRSIKAKSDYYNYIEFLVNKLYEYDPLNNHNSIPYYIPYGGIRLKKFSNTECTSKFNELKQSGRVCTTDECTLQLLNEFYSDKKCGRLFNEVNERESKAAFAFLARRFEGKYSSYDLENEGKNLDFTIDEYYASNTNNTKAFINEYIGNDDDIKFIALLFNVYFPYDDSYAIIIAGIEMINSHIEFNEPYFIFNSSILNKVEIKNVGFFVILILYMIAAVLNFIKVIYEMNIKLIIPTHFIEFLDACGNFVLLTAIYIYLLSLKDIPIIEESNNIFINDNIYRKEFHDFYLVLTLRGYVILILSIIFLSMPIRIMSLLSWSPYISKYLIQFLEILFRMIPSLVVNTIVFIATIIPSIFLNYFLYHSKITNFQNFFSAVLFYTDIFNDMITIKEEEKENNGYSIKYSISDSEYTLIFGIFQKIIFLYAYLCFISSCVNSFERAAHIESKKEDDEIIKKMEEIENILQKEEENYIDNFKNLKKQILWINYEAKNDIYNEILKKAKNMLLCKNSNQVISFLKYLFALKPMMQFKNLKNELCIVIQYQSNNPIDNQSSKINKIDNIQVLLEWLDFVGCKIPVLIYCANNFAFLQKIKVLTSYKLISFTDNLASIEKFVNEEDEINDDSSNNSDEYKIVKVTSFTLYKINYIIVNTKINDSKKSKSDENSDNDESEDEKLNLLNKINKKDEKLDLSIEDNEKGIKNNDNKSDRKNSTLISGNSSSSSSGSDSGSSS